MKRSSILLAAALALHPTLAAADGGPFGLGIVIGEPTGITGMYKLGSGTAAGYDEVYILDVETGADYVEGVRVDGPDLHVFTEPTAGATLDSTMPVPVAWTSDQEASAASIDAEEIGRINVPDSGVYMLSPGALKADKDNARENTIELVRMNRVSPAGAVAGSDVTVAVENWIDVVALPNPAL